MKYHPVIRLAVCVNCQHMHLGLASLCYIAVCTNVRKMNISRH